MSCTEIGGSSTKLQKNLLLLRSKKKAEKSGNMMNFFFQNQENSGESGSIVALRELSQKDKFATVLQYYSLILNPQNLSN